MAASGESIKTDVLILGAGPAGLTAAYELSGRGIGSIVLERDSIPGGLARTVDYKGYLFDLGGHRFYTKLTMIERIWLEVLADDFLIRPRLSRIYFRSTFFDYPLNPLNVVRGLGPIEVFRCAYSYVQSHISPEKPEKNLAAWVSNRFGRRLFEMFFKTYTEKVWGIPCSELSADWAAQRIRGLSLKQLFIDAFRLRHDSDKQRAIKSLIREFRYPRRGPGMMWTKMQELVEGRGSKVILNAPVERIFWDSGRIRAVQAGNQIYEAQHFISSLAIRDFLRLMDPSPSEDLRSAALDFNYRDFITVGLIVRGANLFPDNWIYVHDSRVHVGRIQNYTNWSPEMSPDPGMSCIGMEYFCFEGDSLWRMPDAELQALAAQELAQVGLAKREDVLDGKVIRVPKAYPVYDDTYRRGLNTVKQFLATVPNLQLVGRNGMHRYNNQDHSMLTALMAARNILGARFDLWRLNADSEYLEEGLALSDEDLRQFDASQPLTPYRWNTAAVQSK